VPAHGGIFTTKCFCCNSEAKATFAGSEGTCSAECATEPGTSSEVSIGLCRAHSVRFLRRAYRRDDDEPLGIWEDDPACRGFLRRRDHGAFYDLICAVIAGEEMLDD
jgi:hypothetical protein